MAGENFGAGFGIDITNLKAGLAEANRLIRESESEFREAAAGMDDWSASEEGLTKRTQSLSRQIELQESKVDALVRAKQDIIDKMTAEGKSQEEIAQATDATNKQIINESKQLDRLRGELGKAEKGLDDLGNETEETGKSFEGLKAAGSAAVGAIGAVAAAAGAAVTAFFGLAESTRESRDAMARLETAFETAGLSAEDASSTFTELYGILGDEGKASESAAFLAKYAKDEKALAEQTRILTGVFAEYGESIPTEGLAEGIAASSAMGSVQGVLADALEWQGVNLDSFNESLAACATEQERSALITEALTDLYGESADAYKENNADIIAANEAQAALTETMAQLGAIAEPIMTTLKLLAADLLESMLPFVQLMGEGLQGAFDGTEGSADKLAEGLSGVLGSVVGIAEKMLPTVVETVSALIPQLLKAITDALPSVLRTLTSMLPQLLSALGGMLPSLVSTVTGIILQLSRSIETMLPSIVQTVMVLIPQLVDSLLNAIPALLAAGESLLMGLVDAVPIIATELVSALPSIIESITGTLRESVDLVLYAAIALFQSLIEAIPVIIEELMVALPDIITSIIDLLLDSMPLILDAAIQLLMALVSATPVIIKELWKAIPTIITAIGKALKDSLPKIFETAKELWSQLLDAIPVLIKDLVKNIPSIITTITDNLAKGTAAVFDVGADLIRGLWAGISDMASWLRRKIESFAEGVLDDIKDFFGISSPSKVMADIVGKNLALGIGEGFTDSIGTVARDMQHSLDGFAPSLAVDATAGVAGAAAGRTVNVYQTNNYTQEHSRYELYKSQQQTAQAVRLALRTV